MAAVGVAGTQECGGPFRLVGRVGVVLRLEAESCVLDIVFVLLAANGAVEEVSAVELYAGLVGVDRECDAGGGRCEHGGWEGDVAVGGKHPVVVEAVAVGNLFVVEQLQVAAYGLGRGEVHRSAGYWENLACRHVGAVDGSECGGVDLQDVVLDGALGVAGEAEVGVVCHVDDGGRVGGGCVGYVKPVVAGEGIGDGGGDVAREIVVAVGGVHGEHEGAVVGLFGVVDLVLPAVGAAVEAVAEVVDGELSGVAVDDEASVVDTVGVASYGGAEVGLVVLGKIGLYAVESEHDILWVAVAVGHDERDYASAVVGDAGFHSVVVGKDVERGGLAVDGSCEFIGVESRERLFLSLASGACRDGGCECQVSEGVWSHDYLRFWFVIVNDTSEATGALNSDAQN